MILARHRIFNKHFKARILHNINLVGKFEERLALFLEKPDEAILKNHKLMGKLNGYRSFSIGGDLRVVYRIRGNVLELYDIGSHNQVY